MAQYECPNCGAPLLATATDCPYCGKEMIPIQSAYSQQSMPTQNYEEVPGSNRYQETSNQNFNQQAPNQTNDQQTRNQHAYQQTQNHYYQQAPNQNAYQQAPQYYNQYQQPMYTSPYGYGQLDPGVNPTWPMKNKVVAGLLAIFLGGLGIHKFYLGKVSTGVLYLLFSWTFIPRIISFFEGIGYLCSNDHNFQLKHQVRLR